MLNTRVRLIKKAKNSFPLVSVVMPSLNQVSFLENSIRSVLEQDYANTELIVCDGLSSDGSIDLLIELQIEYGIRLRWFSGKDEGAAEAINRAISLANGEIIGWLNSDDVYLQGAITSAVLHFQSSLNHQLVYGHASHINISGQVASDYPTIAPMNNIDMFLDGSFICQPTVFMRRDALKKIGTLDTSLKLAFDFDLFIRFFKTFPGQIGMVNRMQALSRLHSECMTCRLRSEVAIEGMRVLAKHFNVVPEHWFWTHVDEICSIYPFGLSSLDLVSQVEFFLKSSQNFFSSELVNKFINKLRDDWRLKLSTSRLYLTVHPDGWASESLLVKYRWSDNSVKVIKLHCNAPWPISGKLALKVTTSSGVIHNYKIEVPDDFMIRLELPESFKSGAITWVIKSLNGFVPAKHIKNSIDKRKLSFKVTSIEESDI